MRKSSTAGIGGLMIVALLSACSNEGVYQSLQDNEKKRCEQSPGSIKKDCETDMSYEDYQRERDQL